MKAVELTVGSKVLFPSGVASVVSFDALGVRVRVSSGHEEEVAWDRLVVREMNVAGVQAVHWSVEPWWSSLDSEIRAETLLKLEAVQEILTGYRDGLAEFARPGEPFPPFGEGYGATLWTRIKAMAQTVTTEKQADRKFVRRVLASEVLGTPVSPSTVRLWVMAWQRDGLRGLVDGRKTRSKQGFDALDPRFLRIADEVFASFDGDISVKGQRTIEAEIRVRLKNEGVTDAHLPERLLQEYLSKRVRAAGRTARSHKAVTLRKNSSRSSHPVSRPGALAIDATRADNLVFDETSSKVYSVEIVTAIDIPTRVIVACRVVPLSATALEAGLVLYDAMRPFSMRVTGTSAEDFRWCGIPESLDFGSNPVTAHRSRVRVDRALQGDHIKPGVSPTSVRADNGAIFLSEHFRAILQDFGVDLMPSRAGRPIDNAYVERWHETLQRAYQQIPGFKGRNVRERGRKVMRADTPLLTARELQEHLHRFIALYYHRSPHDGLRTPGMESVSLTPLERFDMLSSATGRILVPQHPDLVYQFLPVRWLTVGHSGVEYRGLTYDGDILENLRRLRSGTFRDQDAKVPFLYDPRDRTRLWHRDRDTDRVHELVWRDAHLVHAPMSDVLVSEARRIVKARGRGQLSKRSVELQIIEEITELTSAPPTEKWRNKVIAARLRHEQAQADHREALDARRLVDAGWGTGVTRSPHTSHTQTDARPVLDQPWPDYDEVI